MKKLFFLLMATAFVLSAQESFQVYEGQDNLKKVKVQVFRPENPNGTGILILPGGGYSFLSSKEGVGQAQWLTQCGITCFVLSYRVHTRHPGPLNDAARAMRIIRKDAEKYKVDPNRIGVLGFSAGGHLASTLATHSDSGKKDAADEIERFSCAPDFQILIYPVITMGESGHKNSRRILLGTNPSPEQVRLLSNELQVTDRTPKAFVCHCTPDTVVSVNDSRMYVEALKAHHVPVEYLELEKGNHGFIGNNQPLIKAFQEHCIQWMKRNNLVQ